MRRQRQFCPGPDFAVIFKMPSGASVGPIKREPSDRFIHGDDKQLKSMIEAVQARVKQARPVAVWRICGFASTRPRRVALTREAISK
jgi:hypothetical protein